jgi:hypothetical protein
MPWMNFINPLAIATRRRAVTTALVYGLSLSVRFTSATGEQVEISLPGQGANPTTLILASDGARASYSHWSLKSLQPIAFQYGWTVPSSSMPSCTAYP